MTTPSENNAAPAAPVSAVQAIAQAIASLSATEKQSISEAASSMRLPDSWKPGAARFLAYLHTEKSQDLKAVTAPKLAMPYFKAFGVDEGALAVLANLSNTNQKLEAIRNPAAAAIANLLG
jgi:hypothetical protein